MGEAVPMTCEASGAQFAIKVDCEARTHCAYRETAIATARFLQQRNPAAKIEVIDQRDGLPVWIDRS